jgi:hypothetical protein
MEPINVIIVGSAKDLSRGFAEAGWSATDPITLTSTWRLFTAWSLNQPYPQAPGTPTFWNGKPNEIAFEKPTPADTVRERHHLHLWDTPYMLNGKPVWVGTVHFDRASAAPGGIVVPAHQIDPAIDRERDGLRSDYSQTRCLAVMTTARVTDSLLGQNALHNPFFTDGNAIVLFVNCPG